MESFIRVAIPLVTFFLTALVGLDISPAAVGTLVHRSRALLVGVVSALALVPLLAWGTVHVFSLPRGLVASFLLTAACPAGTMAGVHSYLARANTAVAVTLVGCSCLLAGVSLPVFLWLFSQGDAPSFSLPWMSLIRQVGLLLVLPVALGVLIRRAAPARVDRLRRPLRVLGASALLVLVAIVIASDPRSFAVGLSAWGPVALFTVATLVSGDAIARLCGLDAGERIAVVLHLPIRNLGIATAIAVGVLQRTDYAAFAAAFFFVQTTLMLLAVGVYSFHRARGVLPDVGAVRHDG
jgi:BASS family bile acid:Na+ symporter